MRKKISIIFLIMVIISLTACGQQKADNQTSSEPQEEKGQYETSEFTDHHIGNLYGGDNIVVRVWAGDSVLSDTTDDSGNITGGYSYAHNVTIKYNIKQSESDDLNTLLQEAIHSEKQEQKAATYFDVKETKKDEEKIWAVLNYGDTTTTEEKILYIKPTGNNSYLYGTISYFTYIKEGYNESLAPQTYIDLARKEYNVTENDGEAIEIEESTTDYTLHEIDIPGYKNEIVSTAYTWDDPQSFYMTYSEDDTSNEPEEGTYVNGFTSSLSGNYISVEIYQGHKDNAYNIIKNYIETFSYIAPDDATYSGIIGEPTRAYIVIHFNYTDNVPNGTVVYLVEGETKNYKIVTIETSSDADQSRFQEALTAYGIDIQDTVQETTETPEANPTPETDQNTETVTEPSNEATQN